MWRCLFGGNPSFNQLDSGNGQEGNLQTFSAKHDAGNLSLPSPRPGPLQMGVAYQNSPTALLKQQSSSALAPSPAPGHYTIKSEIQSPLPVSQPTSGQIFGASRYQQLASKLISMVNTMRAAGAQFTLDLPTVVVCGNQSAGKSSLVEGIINIPLPRSDSTCTRCPVEVRMSEEPQSGVRWSCAVKLRVEYDEYGARLGQPQEVVFQEGITDPLQVEKAVRAAQAALLAPPADAAVAGAAEPLKFTRNVVVLEIRGAPVNLTLIDLPGIIQNVERAQDRPYRGLVTDLVRDYIARDNAIIVATVSCKEDIETQGVLSMAREVDPDGSRTMGVLTKPDQIEEACHGQWLSVLKGDRYPLKLGYYVARNPNQVQLLQGITFEEARKREAEFFKTTNPWCHMYKFADRFGVDHLRSNLSHVLVEITNRAKPRMQSVLSEKLAEVRADLMKLPLLLAADPHSDLLRMIEELSTHIQDQVRAKGHNKSFYQRLLVHFEEFKAAIYRSRPVYLVNQTAAPFTCMVDDDYRDESMGPMPEALAGSDAAPAPMSMEDVREIVMQHHSIELPGFSPYSAVQALITQHQQHWPQHAERCMQKALHELQRMVDRNIAATFARFPRALDLVSNIGRELLDALYGQSLTVVRALVAMESGNAFTLNRHEFEQLSGQYLEQLKSAKGSSPSVPTSTPHSRTTSAHNLGNVSISLAAHVPSRQTSMGPSPLATSPSSRPLKDFSFQQMPGSPASPASGTMHKLGSNTSELLKVPDLYEQDMNMAAGSPRLGRQASTAAGGGGMHSRQVSSMELYQPMRLWLVPQSDRSDGHILGMMAVSLTYFSTSAKRIVDSVPMHVLHYMVSKFADGFRSRLMSEMMAMDSSSVKAALAEDSFTQQQRQALLNQKELLEKVLKILKSC